MRESRARHTSPHPARPEGRDDFVVTEAGACERGSDLESGRLARSDWASRPITIEGLAERDAR